MLFSLLFVLNLVPVVSCGANPTMSPRAPGVCFVCGQMRPGIK